MEGKENLKLRGLARNYLIDLYGTADPDMPNLSSKELKHLWNCARPRSLKGLGKVIVIGTKS